MTLKPMEVDRAFATFLAGVAYLLSEFFDKVEGWKPEKEQRCKN